MDILNIILSSVAIVLSVVCILFSYITQKATMATLRKIKEISVLGAKAASTHTTSNGQNPYLQTIEDYPID